MVIDFAFSAEGFLLLRKFKDKFDCALRIDEPSGDALLLDIGDDSYRISADESVEEFKTAVMESLKSGENLLLERYRDNKVKYEDDMIY
jgi:hypothetical protein|nr:MAG TPA: hypothetical protein [Caudoviricetes sp.]